MFFFPNYHFPAVRFSLFVLWSVLSIPTPLTILSFRSPFLKKKDILLLPLCPLKVRNNNSVGLLLSYVLLVQRLCLITSRFRIHRFVYSSGKTFEVFLKIFFFLRGVTVIQSLWIFLFNMNCHPLSSHSVTLITSGVHCDTSSINSESKLRGVINKTNGVRGEFLSFISFCIFIAFSPSNQPLPVYLIAARGTSNRRLLNKSNFNTKFCKSYWWICRNFAPLVWSLTL